MRTDNLSEEENNTDDIGSKFMKLIFDNVRKELGDENTEIINFIEELIPGKEDQKDSEVKEDQKEVKSETQIRECISKQRNKPVDQITLDNWQDKFIYLSTQGKINHKGLNNCVSIFNLLKPVEQYAFLSSIGKLNDNNNSECPYPNNQDIENCSWFEKLNDRIDTLEKSTNNYLKKLALLHDADTSEDNLLSDE